jgi:hypothetical protein
MSQHRVKALSRWALVVSLTLGVPGFWSSGELIVGLFQELLTVAGVTFTVAGLWLAIFAGRELSSDDPEPDRVVDLTTSMAVAAAVTIVVLAMRYVALATSAFVPSEAIDYLKVPALALWVYCALALVWSILLTLPAAVALIETIRGRKWLRDR